MLVGVLAGLPGVSVAQDPHAGNPHAGGARTQGPQDGSVDSAETPIGTLEVLILDADERPVPGVEVQLGKLHNSVAKGESREKLLATTDAQGRASFQNLESGMAYSYRVAVQHGPAMFSTMPFGMSDKAGKRALLHVYEAQSDVSQVMVGMEAMVFMSLKEDSILVEHMFNIYNFGKVAWLARERFQLPEGYMAWSTQEEMVESPFKDVDGFVSLTGTFGPGRHGGTYRYQVPLSSETQVVKIPMPPKVLRVRVISQASSTMNLMVSGFPGANRVTNSDGRKMLVTEKTSEGAHAPIGPLEITLSGLPTHGYGRWFAAGMAAAAIGGGALYVYQRREDDELPEDTREDLLEAREALLKEIVALEKAHLSGEVGPETYRRLRAALTDSLARIVSQLDRAKPRRKKKAARPARGGEARA